MTEEAAERLMQALDNSLAAKAVWQSLAVTAAAQGPVSRQLILGALFTAQTRLDFDSVMNSGTDIGDISARARDQICRFRESIADVVPERAHTPRRSGVN